MRININYDYNPYKDKTIVMFFVEIKMTIITLTDSR